LVHKLAFHGWRRSVRTGMLMFIVATGYVGCMGSRKVITDPGLDRFEPAHHILPETYFMHALGSAYALSRRSAALLSAIPAPFWRAFAGEDVSMAARMLALDVSYLHDTRMCSDSCVDGAALCDDVGEPRPEDALAHLHHLHKLCQVGEEHVNEAQVVDLALDASEGGVGGRRGAGGNWGGEAAQGTQVRSAADGAGDGNSKAQY
jgi:hypothetical protein